MARGAEVGVICHVKGCDGFAKRCFVALAKPTQYRGGHWVVVHFCADHWPASVRS